MPGTPAGVKVTPNGCPIDSDNDDIADYLDKCLSVAGVAAFEGCPDTDGDGVPDSMDKCPTVKGLASLNGCPDTDGDGIADAVRKYLADNGIDAGTMTAKGYGETMPVADNNTAAGRTKNRRVEFKVVF